MPPEAADCPAQRFQGGHGINRTGKGIAHPFAGTQALDDGRIEPALSGGNAGNIAPRLDLVAQKRSFFSEEWGATGWLCRELVVTLQARLLYRGDPRKPYLPVDTLAGTAEFRLGQVAETVQGEIVLVQFHNLRRSA